METFFDCRSERRFAERRLRSVRGVGILGIVAILIDLFICADCFAQEEGPASELPAVQWFAPGFEVEELPVSLSNLIHVEYASDGRLIAAGYDGRMHVLRDTDGDGREDEVKTFWDQTTSDYPLGMVVRDNAVYVLHKLELVRYLDEDRDGIPERRETVIKDWDDPKLADHPLLLRRRVDYGMGLAIDEAGSIYIGMGNAAYNNAYMLDAEGKLGEKNRSHYDPNNLRGCVLKFSPDGKQMERLVTGVRYLMCLRFNRASDLFATDQEGATWLPNGNPFDELLHLEQGRHYGFPPRHPVYLPQVIDEPSVFDYAPQHQSLCGFRFNDGGGGDKRFGPAAWHDDAFLAGYTRGKIYRTQLVKTPQGYVAQSQLIASLQSLASDLTFSPQGALVVATHSGKPDWGTGPSGPGHLYRIRYVDPEVPFPVATWRAGPAEIRVAFDRALDVSRVKAIAKGIRVESGRSVFAGDRFESIRPGYAVVKEQVADPREEIPVVSTAVSADRRTVSIRTTERRGGWNDAISLAFPSAREPVPQTIAMEQTIEQQTDASGIVGEWRSGTDDPAWSGWLPHSNADVIERFTQGSAEHEALREPLAQEGTLIMRGQLDLFQMLNPAVQRISQLDYDPGIEQVHVVFWATKPFRLQWDGQEHPSQAEEKGFRAEVVSPGRADQWVPYTWAIPTGNVDFGAYWFTDADARPRALHLRRFKLPWAVPPTMEGEQRVDRSKMPELVGGDRARGRLVFLSDAANCSKCHVVRGEGNKLAPDLSNLVQRDFESVMRDVREPSAALNPDYLSYSVLTTDGRALSGTLHRETSDSVTLADNTGKLVELPRSEIETMQPSTVSNMPQGIVEKLNPEQLKDLMAFLLLPPE